MAGSSEFGFDLARTVPETVATRIRGSAIVTVQESKIDSGIAGALYTIAIADAQFPIDVGVNSFDFDFEIPPAYSGESGAYNITFRLLTGETENVESSWAEIAVSSCEILVRDKWSANAVAPLTMTPLAFKGLTNYGSGGFHVEKTGGLSGATTIALLGYFLPTAPPSVYADMEFYQPRCAPLAEFVEIDPPVELPFDTNWGWTQSDPQFETLPAQESHICKVSIDGAAPVYAAIANVEGY